MFVLPAISPSLAPYIIWLPAACALLFLLLLWLFKWRHEALAAKYARWQSEAQAIEVATHDGLYKKSANDVKPAYPNVSIIVPTHGEVSELEYLLPRLLNMEYDGKFEVIVADEVSLEDTKAVVNRLSAQAPTLRYTRVPTTSRQIELRKLAITLGVRAAHGDWVIVLSPLTAPENRQWLQHFAENLNSELDLVEAYYNYYDDGSLRARRAILERVRDFNLRLNAYEQGLIIGCSSANFAMRKDWFVKHSGFADSLTLPFGEESIIAYRHATTERSVLLCSPDTKLTEYLPEDDELTSRRIFMAETFRQILRMKPCPPSPSLHKRHARLGYSLLGFLLWRHAWWYRLRERINMVLTYLFALTVVGYTAWRVWADVSAGAYNMAYLYTDIAIALLSILSLILPIVTLRRTLRSLNERKYGLYIVWFDLTLPWRRLSIGFKRRIRSKNFTRRNFEP